MIDNWKEFCISQIPKMKVRFRQMMGREPDLVNPKRFTDKLEWLKAYDSTFLKTMCADKILVRDYVKEKLSEDISIPLLGVYDKFDDIDFSKLSKDYVMKTNHGSHTNIIVRNGNINKINTKRQFENWLSKDWSWYGYELHYIPIKRKILIEKYMDNGPDGLIDYRFWCFNGKPMFYGANTDFGHGDITYYDLSGNLYNIQRNDYKPTNNFSKPSRLQDMIKIATILSKDFKFVRVDLYEIKNKVYFGELTFIPGAAYIHYKDDGDFKLGEMLDL